MDIVNIILWIVLGGVAGWLAHMITGRGGGLITNIVVGIVGVIVAIVIIVVAVVVVVVIVIVKIFCTSER